VITAADTAQGPGDFAEHYPGHILPSQVDRPYISAGHAAESPQAGPAHASPMPAVGYGIPAPVQLGSAPVTGYVSHHVASSLTMGSPSDR
jgi:hypothetical protein